MAQTKTAGISKQRKTRKKGFKQTMRRYGLVYLMFLIPLSVLLIFKYIPMYGAQIAFRNYKPALGVLQSQWVGFKNFIKFFESPYFWTTIKNTLTLNIYSLLTFPLCLVFALMLRYCRSQRFGKSVQMVSYAPHFISTVVVCGMVILFTNPTSGIINVGLKTIGITPIAFMQRPDLFKWVYVLSGIWQGMGWGAIIYFAALSGVDRSLLEAAEIDGANRLQRIIYINFPVLVPTMITLFILQCGQVLNVGYEKVYALQNPTNLTGSEVISTYVYKVGLVDKDFSFSTAAGLFNSVVNCVVLVLVNWISRRTTNTSLICSDLMQRKGTTCIQKLKEQMTCNYGSTRAPLMKRMLCREMIFAL